VTTANAREIVRQHVLKGEGLSHWVFSRGWEQKEMDFEGPPSPKMEKTPHTRDIPFFGMQNPVVMKNRGLIQADRIEEYIAREGYFAAAKALYQMSSEEIIKEVKTSGIRGRGGAGFPTGMKWDFASKSTGSVKYVLCNADEGDPGAFMDRCVLESDPHAVLEGMVIAAKAIGSHQGYIYCRAEYPLAVKTLNLAIEQARTYGLLGKNILGSGFDFDVEVYRGAGAFVCGEETAHDFPRRKTRYAQAPASFPRSRGSGKTDGAQQRRDSGEHLSDHSERGSGTPAWDLRSWGTKVLP
jgi:hypothetical protein